MPIPEESLLKFPVDFPIKIMGISKEGFQDSIGLLIREHAPDFLPDTIRVGQSKTGKYTALTAVVHATSREQLDRLYLALTHHPDVKVVL